MSVQKTSSFVAIEYRKSHGMLVRATRGYDYKGIHNTRYAAEFLPLPRSISEMYRYMDDSIMRAWIRFLFGRLLCQFFFAVQKVYRTCVSAQATVTTVEQLLPALWKNTGKLREQISATMDRKIGVHVVVVYVLSRYDIKFRYLNEIFKTVDKKKINYIYNLFIYNFLITISIIIIYFIRQNI